MQRNQTIDNDSQHSEEQDPIDELLENIDQFEASCEGLAEAHKEASEETKIRFHNISHLTSVRFQAFVAVQVIERLTRSIAILPLKDLEVNMKAFARSKSFRVLAQCFRDVADEIEDFEDEWNDMKPEGATAASATVAMTHRRNPDYSLDNEIFQHLTPPQQDARREAYKERDKKTTLGPH